MTQPKDHMSMASQNGRPRIISGALGGKKKKKFEQGLRMRAGQTCVWVSQAAVIVSFYVTEGENLAVLKMDVLGATNL